jgi:hypothetical protein
MKARALLAAMLDCIRRGGDTPLNFGIDGAAVVRAALALVPACRPDELDAAAAELLGVPWTAGAATLDAWLDRFYLAARTVDPQAVEILGLRLDGFEDREIAAKLDLGPRLVRRIIRDVACSCP